MWKACVPVGSCEDILRQLPELGGGDLYLLPGSLPLRRYGGKLEVLDGQDTVADGIGNVFLKLAPPKKRQAFEDTGSVTFAINLEGIGRFRLNVYKDRCGPAASVRHVPDHVLHVNQLGMPGSARWLLSTRSGLILVTGPAGAGKTTTAASLAEALARQRPVHVVSIEDPIEYLLEAGRAIIRQREVGKHCQDPVAAVRAAPQEGADIVLLGKADGPDVIGAVLDIAAAGCLVFVTMCAQGSADAVDRLLGRMHPGRTEGNRSALASSLRGILSQRLLPKSDGSGLAAAFEVVAASPAAKGSIREGGGSALANMMQASSAKGGVCLLDEALMGLVAAGDVEFDEAAAQAADEDEFRRRYSPLGDHSAEEEGREGEDRIAPRKTSAGMTRRQTRAEMFLASTKATPPGGQRGLRAAFSSDTTGIPADDENGEDQEQSALLDPRIMSGRRILVVDDDAAVREVMERMLREMGAQVTAVARPSTALSELGSGAYDLAFFDILMPEFSGIELYDRVTERLPILSERILFVTAHNPDRRLTDRIAARGGKLILKPFGVPDMLKAAAFALGVGK